MAPRMKAAARGGTRVESRARRARLFFGVALSAATLASLLVQVAGHASTRISADQSAPSNFQVDQSAAAPVAPYTDNFPANFKMEPSIARDPVTGAFIAGAMDYGDEAPCVQTGTGTIGSTQYASGNCASSFSYTGIDAAYLSADGTSWTQPAQNDGATGYTGASCTAVTHTLPGYCAAGLASGYDVNIAFGPKPNSTGGGFSWTAGARAYYSDLPLQLNTNFPGPAVAISRSDDDGATWLSPVVLTGTAFSRSSQNFVHDKDAMWVDANSASPCFGDAYMAWDLSADNGKTWQVAFSRSIDGGTTWSQWITLLSQPTVLSPGPVIRSLPDGTVAVAWQDYYANQSPATIRDVTLSGCGQTPSTLVAAATFHNPPALLPGSSVPVANFPSMATDASGRVYLSWMDYNTSTHISRIEFSKSADKGQTWSTPVAVSNRYRTGAYPAIAVTPTGGQILIEYQSVTAKAKTPGPGSALIQAVYVRSWNSGQSWNLYPLSPAPADVDGSSTPNLRQQRLGDYTTMIITSFNGKLVAYPIWTDPRNAASCSLVDSYRAALRANQNPPPARPDPDVLNQCPLGFGVTDIYDATIPLN